MYYITFFVWPYILYTIFFVFLLMNKSEDVLIYFRRTLIHITSSDLRKFSFEADHVLNRGYLKDSGALYWYRTAPAFANVC
jgi:hypothetical protein